MLSNIIVISALAMLAGAILSMIRVVSAYEGGVILRLGKVHKVAQPGINFLLPFGIDQLLMTQTCLQTLEITPQDVITQDNVSVHVEAIANYRVTNPLKAIIEVDDIDETIEQYAQTALRRVIGSHKLDDLISKQDMLNEALKESISAEVDNWGVDIERVEIKSLDLDAQLQRAMAAEAEAERGRRARIITAQGEKEAATILREAAEELAKSPNAMALRTLATLKDIGTDHNSVIIFPLPQEAMMAPSQGTTQAALAQAVSQSVAKQREVEPL